jgi:hypothetical protein
MRVLEFANSAMASRTLDTRSAGGENNRESNGQGVAFPAQIPANPVESDAAMIRLAIAQTALESRKGDLRHPLKTHGKQTL